MTSWAIHKELAPAMLHNKARLSRRRNSKVAHDDQLAKRNIAINHAQYYQARTVFDAVPINTFCQLYPNGR